MVNWRQTAKFTEVANRLGSKGAKNTGSRKDQSYVAKGLPAKSPGRKKSINLK